MIKVILADGTIVFHLTCQGKCFCQMCGRGYGLTPARGPGLMMNVLVSQGAAMARLPPARGPGLMMNVLCFNF